MTTTVWRTEGDVVRLGGRLWVVDRVNESGARCVPLVRRRREATLRQFRKGGVETEVRSLPEPERFIRINPTRDADDGMTVARLGCNWRSKDFAAAVPGYSDEAKTGEANKQGKEDSMAKKNKSKKNGSGSPPRGGLAAQAAEAATNGDGETKRSRKVRATKPKGDKKPGAGRMGKIFDHSVCAVVRKLGEEKVGIKHATAILAARGISMPPASLSVQLGFGRSGKRPAAPLTKDQVKELKDSAPEPVETESAKAE